MMNTGSAAVTVQIMGPTASGKTALALALAQRLTVEIVSVDSAQVYRGMDIGSAKPSLVERQRVPHHLINIRDPAETYSAAEFVRDASALIPNIIERNHLPVLVGGTMLYFKALNDGLNDMPGANAALRAALEAEAAQSGWPALHERLQQIDPISAARLNPSDAQRIQRALEVYRLTGRPLSSFHTQTKPQAPPLNALKIALLPADRSALHARIAQRFEQMLAAGFLDEMEQLRARGDLHADLPSMRAVGYRQAWDYLEGRISSLSEFRERASAATRQLAKRQMTWLRSWQADVWISTLPDNAAALKALELQVWTAIQAKIEP
jgi:tRNA dimethylallyltransferase